MKRFSKTVSNVNVVLFFMNLIGAYAVGALTTPPHEQFNLKIALIIVAYAIIQWLIGICIHHHFKNQEMLLEIHGVKYKDENTEQQADTEQTE